jgi:trigger factor
VIYIKTKKEIDYIIQSNRTLEDADVVGTDRNYLLDVILFRLNENGEKENKKGEKIEIDLSKEGVNKEIIENAKNKKTGDSFSFGFDDERTFKNDKGEDEKVKEHFDYEVEIKGIKKIILPELNDELVKKVTKENIKYQNEA